MIEEEFLAVIKLVSSEEILAIAAPMKGDQLLVTNPIVIQPAIARSGFTVFKVIPWLKTTTADTVIIDKRNIITLVECFDQEMVDLYNQYLKGKDLYFTGNQRKLTKETGSSSTTNREF
jgi:hypothetical protein